MNSRDRKIERQALRIVAAERKLRQEELLLNVMLLTRRVDDMTEGVLLRSADAKARRA